jgi:hypothetical protein
MCADCCVPTGGECQTPEDCCGGVCGPDPNDGNKLKCNPPVSECVNDGEGCFSNADCCSGLCSGGEFPTCQPSPCKSIGATCTGTECCMGLTCQNGFCSQ